MARGRGGYQAPKKPAPVSNPGSGARTDGGPGSERQPVRVAPGGTYGTRQQLEGQQEAIPLERAPAVPTGPATGPGSGGGGGVPTGPVGNGGVFGPTQRPDQPLVSPRNEMLPRNPDELIALLYQVSGGDPAIGRLLRTSRRQRGLDVPPE